jgi:hypothetical protein
MYYIYFMRNGKKCPIDNGKYYSSPKDAAKRLRQLSKGYRTQCLIEQIPVSQSA